MGERFHLETDESSNLPDRFWKIVRENISDRGVQPQHVMWRIGRTIRHETAPVENKHLLSMCCDILVRAIGVEELIFGIECKRDLEFKPRWDWAVVVAYGRPANWRFGVIDYKFEARAKPPVTILPIQWDVDVVTTRMKKMIRHGLEIHENRKSIQNFLVSQN